MDIDLAIKKLNAFKKMAKGIGECDLVALEENSFVVKVQFGGSKPIEHKPVIGFAASAKD